MGPPQKNATGFMHFCIHVCSFSWTIAHTRVYRMMVGRLKGIRAVQSFPRWCLDEKRHHCLGWRMHCGAEVTESSTNKQHHPTGEFSLSCACFTSGLAPPSAGALGPPGSRSWPPAPASAPSSPAPAPAVYCMVSTAKH